MVRFRFAGIPVAVQPWFWVLAVVLGLGRITGPGLAVWVAVVFVSVLVHELGHAFTLRGYGYRPAVLLHMIGGLTSWEPAEELPPARRIVSTLAGPFVGFLLAGVAFAAWWALDGREVGGLWLDALRWSFFVNLVWGVFNLVPIRGLDGGQALGGFLELVLPRHGKRVAEAVYLVTGATAVIVAVLYERYLLAIFVAAITFGGAFSGRRRAPRPAPASDTGPPKLGI